MVYASLSRYCGYGYVVFGLLLAEAGLYIGMNTKFPYTYFNPIAGGTKGAYGHYETDYWGTSTRQGCEWLEQQGILKPDRVSNNLEGVNA